MEGELLSTPEAAKYIGMSEGYLRQIRSKADARNRFRTPGPVYLRLGRKIRYRRADLDEWLAAREVRATETYR